MQFARGATIILRETRLQDHELCLGSDGPVAVYLVCSIDQLDYPGLQITTICVFKANQEDFDCLQSTYTILPLSFSRFWVLMQLQLAVSESPALVDDVKSDTNLFFNDGESELSFSASHAHPRWCF